MPPLMVDSNRAIMRGFVAIYSSGIRRLEIRHEMSQSIRSLNGIVLSF